ncbi:Uncharacterised protein [Scardovia inopinata]|uniref:Uncharacterized protein n=1 Tax=Scardovia inopinata F0304 TaxID=641146 RepID=W1MXD9_SCAIO|nr:hypothetical protein HMPREF9020_01518 [Scardovia inopinata F0304]SUV50819.1 Uncharacterised protein [Scardovia inopinata]
MAAHVGRDLVQVGGGRVDERTYVGPRVDVVDEGAHPVGVAPCGVLVALPIEHEDRSADVGAHGVDEVVGFGGHVAAAGVVVEAEALASLSHAVVLAGHVPVGEAGALRGLDHGEVVVGGAGDGRRLPAAHVDSMHVGHSAGRDGEHGE